VAIKILAAVAAAVILAIIGAKAGAHTPVPPDITGMGAPLQGAASPPLPARPPAPSQANERAEATTDAEAPQSSGLLADGRIILNVANEEELMKLPGIGPARARAILALRQRLARFRAIEDLLRVKGIGRKTLRRIKPNVVLDRPSGSDAGQGPSIALQ